MASPFFSPFRRPPMNPFGSMMGFGMGPNLFSGGMPFYNPFPRMPMYGGGLGGFGGFGGMGGGFNPFMMSPPPMQRFPRYDSLIPMQSQMPSQSLQNLPYQPKRPEMTSIEESSPMMQSDTQQTTSINPMTTEPIDMVDPNMWSHIYTVDYHMNVSRVHDAIMGKKITGIEEVDIDGLKSTINEVLSHETNRNHALIAETPNKIEIKLPEGKFDAQEFEAL